jgi:glycosyltransferase involved in cell wall biosynthesis
MQVANSDRDGCFDVPFRLGRNMRIGILLSHPTQFEGPFFRFAASTGEAQLKVLYLSTDDKGQVFDTELGQKISWGIDLMSGYNYKSVPYRGWGRWLWRELTRENYDCLVINGYSRMQYLVAAVFARIRSVKPVLRIDSVLFNDTVPARRLAKTIVYPLLFRLYDHFFATGTLTREYLKYYGVKPKDVSLFPYAIDVDHFRRRDHAARSIRDELRKRYDIPLDARVILSVTKFNERECPWDLVEAFTRLSDPTLCIVLVGDGRLRPPVEAFFMEKKCQRAVFLGYVPYLLLADIYAMADVFVHAVQHESWGVSVAEAMASGLPIITSSRVGSGYDLIRQGCNGYCYEVGNVEELMDAILRSLSELDSEVVRETNERVLSRWDYATTWKSVLKGCERVVYGTLTAVGKNA